MYVPPQAVPCQCTECYENNCDINLRGMTHELYIIGLNCLKKIRRQPGNIADCAILWKNQDVFAIVELKGGQVPSPKAVSQIQGGVDLMMPLFIKQKVHQLYPILMYKGKDPTHVFATERISFRGEKRRIIVAECGTRLEDILVKLKKRKLAGHRMRFG